MAKEKKTDELVSQVLSAIGNKASEIEEVKDNDDIKVKKSKIVFKIKPVRENPGTLLYSGKPKIGKTTLLSLLENNLLISTECNGASYITGVPVYDCTNILTATPEQIKDLLTSNTDTKVLDLGEISNPIIKYHAFMRILNALLYFNKPYRYVSIDTLTQLDIEAEISGTDLYMNSLQGSNFNEVPKDDTVKVPKEEKKFYKYGDAKYQTILDLGKNGWRWSRTIMVNIMNLSRQVSGECTIYVTHIKDKLLKFDDKEEVYVKDIALTGTVADIYSRNVDALATVYRNDNQELMINFKGNEEKSGGIRLRRLNNFEGKFEWDKIFIDNSKEKE